MITPKEPKVESPKTFLTQLPAASEINLYSRTWSDYEEILDAVGEASGLRISFDGEDINYKVIDKTTDEKESIK